jgi:hypothetical protein
MDDTMLQQLLSQATPEELQQLLGLGTLDERGGLLEQQLAQAQALRTNNAAHHSTGLGAGLAGIGDALTGYASGAQQKALGAQQQALLAQKDAGRNVYVDLLRRRPGAATAGAGDFLGAGPAQLSPFGLG